MRTRPNEAECERQYDPTRCQLIRKASRGTHAYVPRATRRAFNVECPSLLHNLNTEMDMSSHNINDCPCEDCAQERIREDEWAAMENECERVKMHFVRKWKEPIRKARFVEHRER